MDLKQKLSFIVAVTFPVLAVSIYLVLVPVQAIATGRCPGAQIDVSGDPTCGSSSCPNGAGGCIPNGHTGWVIYCGTQAGTCHAQNGTRCWECGGAASCSSRGMINGGDPSCFGESCFNGNGGCIANGAQGNFAQCSGGLNGITNGMCSNGCIMCQ